MDEEGLKNTAHEKIFIGKPGYFNLVKLKQAISRLMYISSKNDMVELRNTLKSIVPTYKENIEESASMAKEEIAATATFQAINNYNNKRCLV